MMTALALGFAIITQDQAALRPSPKTSAKAAAVLYQGETVEVRGERLDYLQVWDHRRERGGYVRASQVRRVKLTVDEAPDLLATLRFLKTLPNHESLAIGIAAAYIESAPAEVLHGPAGIEALDALGTMAERLAARVSQGRAPTAHLEVARRYGIRFASVERNERVHLCYDGSAFKRVLSYENSTPEQRARAALAVTRPECIPGDTPPAERRKLDEWRAETLDLVDEATLPDYVKNRVQMRRAAVWASLAYQRARHGEAHAAAAARALASISSIKKSELAEEDLSSYSEAAMRVNASRWASVKKSPPPDVPAKRPQIITTQGAPGETCILLVSAQSGPDRPLARRCTYGLVWTASATLNREGNALAVAVQPTDAWREMWLFHQTKKGWAVRVLPPSSSNPNVGYAEFAGWVPGGSQVLVAREAVADGKRQRHFELVRLDTLAPVRQASEPMQLAAFQRWQDPGWKKETLSLR
jgi:hypothetical protein